MVFQIVGELVEVAPDGNIVGVDFYAAGVLVFFVGDVDVEFVFATVWVEVYLGPGAGALGFYEEFLDALDEVDVVHVFLARCRSWSILAKKSGSE